MPKATPVMSPSAVSETWNSCLIGSNTIETMVRSMAPEDITGKSTKMSTQRWRSLKASPVFVPAAPPCSVIPEGPGTAGELEAADTSDLVIGADRACRAQQEPACRIETQQCHNDAPAQPLLGAVEVADAIAQHARHHGSERHPHEIGDHERDGISGGATLGSHDRQQRRDESGEDAEHDRAGNGAENGVFRQGGHQMADGIERKDQQHSIARYLAEPRNVP